MMTMSRVLRKLTVTGFLVAFVASLVHSAAAAAVSQPNCESLDTVVANVNKAYDACASGGVSPAVLDCLRLSADAIIQYLKDENLQCYNPDVVGSSMGYKFGACAGLAKAVDGPAHIMRLKEEQDEKENLLNKNESDHQSCSGSCWWCCYLRSVYQIAADSCFATCR